MVLFGFEILFRILGYKSNTSLRTSFSYIWVWLHILIWYRKSNRTYTIKYSVFLVYSICLVYLLLLLKQESTLYVSSPLYLFHWSWKSFNFIWSNSHSIYFAYSCSSIWPLYADGALLSWGFNSLLRHFVHTLILVLPSSFWTYKQSMLFLSYKGEENFT